MAVLFVYRQESGFLGHDDVAVRIEPSVALAVENQVRLFGTGEAQGEFAPVFVLPVLGQLDRKSVV